MGPIVQRTRFKEHSLHCGGHILKVVLGELLIAEPELVVREWGLSRSIWLHNNMIHEW